MKHFWEKIYIIILFVILVLFNGCTSQVESLAAVGIDESLPQIHNVRSKIDSSSIGFEWNLIEDDRVNGIDIYRAVDNGTNEVEFKKIATLGNRYFTHFVDTDIVPQTKYIYRFRTFGVFKGSPKGNIIRVKAPNPIAPVELVSVYMVDSGVVKILWRPHQYVGVYDYIIERKLRGRGWKYLATVKGRLSPEYIDMSPAKGYNYSYRVIARLADRIKAIPSRELSVLIE